MVIVLRAADLLRSESRNLQGKSIKDYVLERTLPDSQEKAALQKLESFLKPRIDAAMKGERSSLSVDEIFDEIENQSQSS